MHSGGDEFRKSARSDKWNNNQVTVIGGFRSKKESGSRIIIHINKRFGSDKSNVANVQLKQDLGVQHLFKLILVVKVKF